MPSSGLIGIAQIRMITPSQHGHADMQPLILAINPALVAHISTLTPQAIADALADALPQALAQLAADSSTAAIVQNCDMRGLHPSQVLTLQLATLDSFLDVQDAANG